jgi:hypothetical protein
LSGGEAFSSAGYHRCLRGQQTKWHGMLMLRWRMGAVRQHGALGKPSELSWGTPYWWVLVN